MEQRVAIIGSIATVALRFMHIVMSVKLVHSHATHMPSASTHGSYYCVAWGSLIGDEFNFIGQLAVLVVW